MKVSLIAEDFSALGQISMVSALSIFSALNLPTAALPTTLLSTQTEGFGIPTELHTHQWGPQALLHWKATHEIDIGAALIGYIGTNLVVQQLSQVLKAYQPELILVDPVMGDEGVLYPGFDAAYVEDIRELASQATILTPNWTELHLLAGQKISTDIDEAKLKELLDILVQQGITARVIVTGIEKNDEMGLVYQNIDGSFTWWMSPKFDGHFYGTGDAFSAVLCGYLQSNLSFEEAVNAAVKGVYGAIKLTAKGTPENRKFGLQLNGLLAELAEFSLNNGK